MNTLQFYCRLNLVQNTFNFGYGTLRDIENDKNYLGYHVFSGKKTCKMIECDPLRMTMNGTNNVITYQCVLFDASKMNKTDWCSKIVFLLNNNYLIIRKNDRFVSVEMTLDRFNEYKSKNGEFKKVIPFNLCLCGLCIMIHSVSNKNGKKKQIGIDYGLLSNIDRMPSISGTKIKRIKYGVEDPHES